jgi:hypothetical protein
MERISGFEVDSFLSQNNHSDGAKTILVRDTDEILSMFAAFINSIKYRQMPWRGPSIKSTVQALFIVILDAATCVFSQIVHRTRCTSYCLTSLMQRLNTTVMAV